MNAVLSDDNKRSLYDSGIYNFNDGLDEDFWEFIKEIVPLGGNARTNRNKSCMRCSMKWLVDIDLIRACPVD